MVQHKRGIGRTQTSLLPASIEDYVKPESLVRVIDLYAEQLDMRALGFKRAVPKATGRPAYAPQDLLKLYMYGYWYRIRSSRRLEAECGRNLELMWLLQQLIPDHKTIANFRKDHGQALVHTCARFVQYLRSAGLVGGADARVAVDGSKFKASASKASVLSEAQLAQAAEKIDKRVQEYMQQLDEADEREGGEAALSKEQIQAALEELRARAQRLKAARQQLAGAAAPADAEGATARVGLTDPDCVLLKSAGKATIAGYNVQQAVDAKHKFIVAHEVTTARNDQSSLEPMASLAQDVLGVQTLTVLADTGYMNGAQAQACEDRGITPVVPMQQPTHTQDENLYSKALFSYEAASDTYRCPAGELLHRYKRDKTQQIDYYSTRRCEQCAAKSQCTKAQYRSIARSWYAGAAERAGQRANRTLRRLRSALVEHPFGNLKAMMPGGFLVRTLTKVRGEMALAVLTYNLKRMLSVVGIRKLLEDLQAQAILKAT